MNFPITSNIANTFGINFTMKTIFEGFLRNKMISPSFFI